MDYIDRRADEGDDDFTRQMYGALRERIERYEGGDPEMQPERMLPRELLIPSLVLVAIIVYYLAVVGLPS